MVSDVFDEEPQFAPPARSRWPAVLLGAFVLAVAGGMVLLCATTEERGLTVRGRGHAVVLPGGAWVFLADGALFPVTGASRELLPATGPCERIDGFLRGEKLHLERVTCLPGSLQPAVAERLRLLGLKAAYWPENLHSEGPGALGGVLETVEVVAAMVDPRFDAPQLVPLWRELFPGAVVRSREAGEVPPPVVVQVERNDRVRERMGRTELGQWLARENFFLAAAAPRGGWIVREVRLTSAARGPVERLLTAPGEGEWPAALEAPVVEAAPWEPGGNLHRTEASDGAPENVLGSAGRHP